MIRLMGWGGYTDFNALENELLDGVGASSGLLGPHDPGSLDLYYIPESP